MKKLIAIVFLMLIVPSIGYSADRVISRFEVPKAEYAVRVLCIDGHKFVNTNNYADIRITVGAGVALANSIVQMFEERDGKSLPAKC